MATKRGRRRRKVTNKFPIYDAENNRVLQFRGDYEFLSNFYECPNGVEFEGMIYPTAENAYQAAKVYEFRRKKFTQISPAEAKKLGRKLPMRYGFEDIKVDVMKQILKSKFERNPELKQKLLETGDAVLIEGNTWGDKFWGVDLREPDTKSEFGFKGKNVLGKLLMELREEFRQQQS